MRVGSRKQEVGGRLPDLAQHIFTSKIAPDWHSNLEKVARSREESILAMITIDQMGYMESSAVAV